MGVSEVEYFGHVLTFQGVKPEQSKVSAICDIDPPKNKAEFQTFLGMKHYLSSLCEHLAEIMSPLRMLLGKEIELFWDKPETGALQKVKDLKTQILA